jgi:hypothetical protein
MSALALISVLSLQILPRIIRYLINFYKAKSILNPPSRSSAGCQAAPMVAGVLCSCLSSSSHLRPPALPTQCHWWCGSSRCSCLGNHFGVVEFEVVVGCHCLVTLNQRAPGPSQCCASHCFVLGGMRLEFPHCQ